MKLSKEVGVRRQTGGDIGGGGSLPGAGRCLYSEGMREQGGLLSDGGAYCRSAARIAGRRDLDLHRNPIFYFNVDHRCTESREQIQSHLGGLAV